MLLRKVLEREKLTVSRMSTKTKRLVKKYSSLTTQNIIIVLTLVLFILLLSGGTVTNFTRTTEQLIYIGLSTEQTFIEFIVYAVIHSLYLLGLYLVYRTLKSTHRLDQGTLMIGFLLFLFSLLLEWYLMHIKRII